MLKNEPESSCEATAPGRKAFGEHPDALEKILNNSRPELPTDNEKD
ncbi:MAG: hypothetical protein J5I98_33970 [Phaeodactylibacter sp.]|nr:hypothetical protein [Phaeodactylibacter sp.]